MKTTIKSKKTNTYKGYAGPLDAGTVLVVRDHGITLNWSEKNLKLPALET